MYHWHGNKTKWIIFERGVREYEDSPFLTYTTQLKMIMQV